METTFLESSGGIPTSGSVVQHQQPSVHCTQTAHHLLLYCYCRAQLQLQLQLDAQVLLHAQVLLTPFRNSVGSCARRRVTSSGTRMQCFIDMVY